ncbi:LexA signal peptidase [Dendrothele bispora CBS 962.96]|uniref:Mitochondrial inner membrane protease subunit n=1 Tax=Dendrothele bispora (strain CBS 962.96) TaxID=1314807 RepID=A0A4S8MYY5_DENBC|nr:LexA signal peptidase [Dendrothele bispora CBS 962.96]
MPTAFVFTQYFYGLKIVSGRSMQPTLNPDSSLWRDVALFDRFSIYAKQKYKRGDIVALKSPTDPNRILVKRIIGLEGDIVKTLPPYPDPEVTVPQGHAWIEGDEPFHSNDSNQFGSVPLALIDSRLVLVVWPLNRFGHLLNKPMQPRNVESGNRSDYRLAMAELERERWRNSRVVTFHRKIDTERS